MSTRNARHRELIARAQNGDGEAMELMLTENSGLVYKAVHLYKNLVESMDDEDLAQVARIGLVDAVRTFDLSRGTRFSTHAWMRIRGQMTRYRRGDRMIVLPAWITDTPDGRAKGAERGLPVVGVRFEQPITADGELTVLDLTPAPNDTEGEAVEAVHREHLIDEVRKALTCVWPRDREALLLYYGFEDGRPRTLEEIAWQRGCSRQAVQQGVERAKRALRERLAPHFGEEP